MFKKFKKRFIKGSQPVEEPPQRPIQPKPRPAKTLLSRSKPSNRGIPTGVNNAGMWIPTIQRTTHKYYVRLSALKVLPENIQRSFRIHGAKIGDDHMVLHEYMTGEDHRKILMYCSLVIDMTTGAIIKDRYGDNNELQHLIFRFENHVGI